MTGSAYIDREFVAPEDAKISIFDWGFLHSDATYDVAHVWQSRHFRLDDHLDRFEASLAALRLNPGVTRERMREVMHKCVRRAGLRDACVEVLCTRGRPAPGSRDPRTCTNRFMAFAIPFVWIADPETQKRGVNLIIGTPQRIPGAKRRSAHQELPLARIRDGPVRGLRTRRRNRGADGSRRHVSEGPGFNLFAVFHGAKPRIVTPAQGVLEGVTRRTMIENLPSTTASTCRWAN